MALSARSWLQPLFTCVALASIVSCGVAASSAQASRFRRLTGGVKAFASDGVRYVAWQRPESSTIVVLDTLSGRRRDVAAPAGCKLEDQGQANGEGPPATDGRFLLTCANGEALLDAPTGTVRMLPSDPAWMTVGSHYVEGVGGTCVQTRLEVREDKPCRALYDIATGAVSYRPRSQVGDLDKPGAPLVCQALKGALVRASSHSYSAGLLARPVVEGSESVQIDGCRGRRTVLAVKKPRKGVLQSGGAENLDIRGGLLTWDTGHGVEGFALATESPTGALYGYQLRTHRRYIWQLPVRGPSPGGFPGTFGYSTHTANTLFWIAIENIGGKEGGVVEASAVYTMPLK
jgi:hypothetical protein